MIESDSAIHSEIRSSTQHMVGIQYLFISSGIKETHTHTYHKQGKVYENTFLASAM